MDVDDPHGGQSDGGSRLEELSEIMVELEDNPMDVQLHRRQVDILQSLPMLDEYIEAIRSLATLVMLSAGTIPATTLLCRRADLDRRMD